jgi:hypothetical protein
MGERKVLNFYVSPDFDHSIIPRIKRDWSNKLHEIRMMLPFSLRCNTCGEYMYAGKKFNSKKELIKGEDYLGIKKFRFYIKCCVFSAEITINTDPKNSDYECESGASRNFELWRETTDAVDAAKKEREEEDKMDSMKSLENRTLDSKIEMDILDALDEMRAINQRHERVDTNALLGSLSSKADEKVMSNGLTKSDEEYLKTIKFKSKHSSSSSSSSSSSIGAGEVIAEHDGEEIKNDDMETNIKRKLLEQMKSSNKPADGTSAPMAIMAKKKRKVDHTSDSGLAKAEAKIEELSVPARTENPQQQQQVSALSLMGGYGDSDDE